MKIDFSLLALVAANTALAKPSEERNPHGMCITVGSRRCVQQGAFEARRWVIRDCDHRGHDRVFEVCPGGCEMKGNGMVRCVDPETQTTTHFFYNGKDHSSD